MSTIDKINQILELLRRHARTGLTNKEISNTLKIPPSTCYRLLSLLRRYDYVSQRKPELRYSLGFAHLRFAEAVLESLDAAAICLPYLEDLHRQTEETSFFALWNGRHCVVVEVCGYINTRIAVGRGELMPLHASAAGKAVLAFLPDKERRRLLEETGLARYTDRTCTDRGALEKELEAIRGSGVSYNCQEFHNGINALASPIFGNRNKVQGALVIVGTSVDLEATQMNEYAEMLVKACAEVSSVLGGEPAA